MDYQLSRKIKNFKEIRSKKENPQFNKFFSPHCQYAIPKGPRKAAACSCSSWF